jgi:hypothetical protein
MLALSVFGNVGIEVLGVEVLVVEGLDVSTGEEFDCKLSVCWAFACNETDSGFCFPCDSSFRCEG